MIKKHGFTLAEVLVTIGILGTVAAYTIPAVTANVQETQLATALKTAHSTISDKIEAEMAIEDVNDVADLKMFKDRSAGAIFKEMGKFMQLSTVDISTHKVDGLNGSKNYREFSASNIRQMHTKAFIILEDVSNHYHTDADAIKNIKAKGGKIYRRNAVVWIDVNGYTKPNRLGYDVFEFFLAQDGRLYPMGGEDVAIYMRKGGEYALWTWNGATKTAVYACNKNSVGLGCAGRVLAEGKINYLRKEKDPTLK